MTARCAASRRKYCGSIATKDTAVQQPTYIQHVVVQDIAEDVYVATVSADIDDRAQDIAGDVLNSSSDGVVGDVAEQVGLVADQRVHGVEDVGSDTTTGPTENYVANVDIVNDAVVIEDRRIPGVVVLDRVVGDVIIGGIVGVIAVGDVVIFTAVIGYGARVGAGLQRAGAGGSGARLRRYGRWALLILYRAFAEVLYFRIGERSVVHGGLVVALRLRNARRVHGFGHRRCAAFCLRHLRCAFVIIHRAATQITLCVIVILNEVADVQVAGRGQVFLIDALLLGTV